VNPHDILAHVREPGYRPGKVKDLARALGVGQYEYRAFRQAVKELERQGQLVRLRHNRYADPGRVEQGAGLFRLHPQGYGWVEREEGRPEILIPPEGMGSAAEGDLVRVEILSQHRHPEGRVVEILQRARQQVVGTFFWQGRNGVVRPDEGRWGRDIPLGRRPPAQARDGYRVRLRLLPGPRGTWEGEIEEVLGDPADPRLDFLVVVAQLGLPLEHPPAVLEEAARLPSDLGPALAGRRDLRGLPCLTVDPADARDFDDAVSLEPLPGGAALLGVHIADVGHYVRPHTALDREALRRGTSVYLADRAIPMLPERLSSHLCTLLPGEDRLALSVLMQVDAEGEVGDFEVVESVIRSAARLTYEEVQSSFEGDPGRAGAFGQLLEAMRRLSLALKERRLGQGALDFDLPEPRVDLDEQGLPTALGQYPRLPSHQLIEEFMLAANGCVVRLARDHQLPVLYRVHRHPDQERLRLFAEYLRTAGVRFDRSRRLAPKDLQGLLARFGGEAEGKLVNRLLLRAMMRAEYTPRDIGHYGLACEHYLHFTSPIRRYPDLLVHRAVKSFLAGVPPEAAPEQLAWTGVWTSSCERRADAAERAYLRSKQLRYMEGRLGEEFSGLVSGVVRSGFFVELEGLMVEGFCALAFLDEYCEYDERRHTLRGQRTGRTFSLGAPVRVQALRVNWSPPRLDLRLLGEERPRRAAKKKKKGRRGARAGR
jgi:ribonuclease R